MIDKSRDIEFLKPEREKEGRTITAQVIPNVVFQAAWLHFSSFPLIFNANGSK
jgi:hypothetical protein